MPGWLVGFVVGTACGIVLHIWWVRRERKRTHPFIYACLVEGCGFRAESNSAPYIAQVGQAHEDRGTHGEATS